MTGTKRKRPCGVSLMPSRLPPEAVIDISSDSDSEKQPLPKAQRFQLAEQIDHDDGFMP
ncbi:hypothetical protein CDV36_016625, partial [Fusarium kuroshium]